MLSDEVEVTYEEVVEGVSNVRLGDMAGGKEVLEGLQEVPRGHRLVVVETIVAWLN